MSWIGSAWMVGLTLGALGCQGPSHGVPVAPNGAEAPKSAGGRGPSLRRAVLLEGGVSRIEIERPDVYWRRAGFVEIFPTVRVSVDAGSVPTTAIYLRVPEHGVITVEERSDGTPALRFPPGSESDRTTYVRAVQADGSERLTVADVRGTRIDANGAEWFHVYRPKSGAAGASLVGYEWPRGSASSAELADSLLVRHVRNHDRATRSTPPGENYVSRFSSMNQCGLCHVHKKPEALSTRERLPPWPTDASGWFAPQAALSESSVLSTTRRFHDPNAGDAFVRAVCRDSDAQLLGGRRDRFYRCDGGGLPLGRRDVARGLKAGDAYTRGVCASREYLWARMAVKDRGVFAAAFQECQLSAQPQSP